MGDIDVVATSDILEYALKIEPDRLNRSHTMVVSEVMTRIGWERPSSGRVYIHGEQVRGFQRKKGEKSSSTEQPTEQAKTQKRWEGKKPW